MAFIQPTYTTCPTGPARWRRAFVCWYYCLLKPHGWTKHWHQGENDWSNMSRIIDNRKWMRRQRTPKVALHLDATIRSRWWCYMLRWKKNQQADLIGRAGACRAAWARPDHHLAAWHGTGRQRSAEYHLHPRLSSRSLLGTRLLRRQRARMKRGGRCNEWMSECARARHESE